MSETSLSDLVIIGAGLAGLTAATAAHRAGHAVTLISAHDRHPPDFRGEKMGEAQLAVFDRAGLGPAARAQLTASDGVSLYRFGRLAERRPDREYMGDYAALVNALGAALPPGVERITGRVAAIATGADTQLVTLADGRHFAGRLLVVATGLSDAIRRMLGIERQLLSAQNSVSLGFDLEQKPEDFAFSSMVWGHEPADRFLSYLTLFPIGGTMRGNLFTYRPITDPWVKSFRQTPTLALRRALPALEREIGPVTVRPDVAMRPIDVTVSANMARDGVVLLGDAFSTCDPITGLGMAKALNDADLLVHRHLPAWLASPGMAAAKLASFYADPQKTALDARATGDSLAGRQTVMGTTPYWQARRVAGTSWRWLRDRIFSNPPLRTPD
ncbi:MAG: FAD-dependent monooxygenase, partial [Hyphomicrobiales bacterium]